MNRHYLTGAAFGLTGGGHLGELGAITRLAVTFLADAGER
jgi:hypothetical protein